MYGCEVKGALDTTTTDRASALPQDLDPEIADAVRALHAAGIFTYESCQGGEGHMRGTSNEPEAFISFRGDWKEGFMALALFLGHHHYRVHELQRVWRVIDGEPEGPSWRLTFWPISPQR